MTKCSRAPGVATRTWSSWQRETASPTSPRRRRHDDGWRGRQLHAGRTDALRSAGAAISRDETDGWAADCVPAGRLVGASVREVQSGDVVERTVRWARTATSRLSASGWHTADGRKHAEIRRRRRRG